MVLLQMLNVEVSFNECVFETTELEWSKRTVDNSSIDRNLNQEVKI